MKGVLLAIGWTLIDFAIITAVLRSRQISRRAATLATIWWVSVPGLIATHLLVPADAWVLPSWLTEPWTVADLGLGLIVYAAAFFGGLLQLYNLADRGFSLRILVDLHEAGCPLTTEQIAAVYGAGQGIGWMFGKRVDDLVARGLVRREGERLRATPAGRRAAALLGRLQGVLRVE